MEKTVSKAAALVAATLIMICSTFAVTQTTSAEEAYAATSQTQAVYRLYNRWSNEHLYTTGKSEYDKLVKKGWNGEGVAWHAPLQGNPVYRLYNQWSGDHHYTTSKKEYDDCNAVGWTGEGIAFRSGGNQPIYRLFNPYATSFFHHYPSSKVERDQCLAAGWKNEDVGWYGYSFAVDADSNGSHGATNQPSAPDSQKPVDPIASAQAAYDAAKTAYDAIDVEGARRSLSAAQTRADEAARVSSSAQVAYEEAAKAAEPLKDAQDVATAQVTRANTKAIAAQYSLNAAEQTLADIKEGTIIPSLKDFFVDMNSDYALRQFTRSYQGEVLTEINEATHSGIAGDCTDYRNVLRALDTIRDLNKVRASLGLNELMVSDEMMARETVSTNWSANNIAHSTGCGAENLAWGWNKPVDGWYDSEKIIWDQAVETGTFNGTPLPDGWQTMSAAKLSRSAPDFYHAVGHYLNVIDKSFTVVGAACNTNGSIYRIAMGQTYRSYTNDNELTVDQWEARFQQWVDDKLNNADRNQAIQQAEEERDAALASLTAANKELAEAQEAQETATARYNAAMKDVNAKKATADKEAAAAQKAAQDLAGAQAVYDKAVSDKRTALASLDAAREKLEQLTS